MTEPSQVLSRTPLTMDQVRGYLSQYVQQPALGYLMALLHLENAGGSKIYNHNWGNITTRNPDEAFQFPTHPDHLFLQNPNHSEGARRFFQLLNSPTHRRMLEAARGNDFEAFWDGYQTPHPVTKMMYCNTCSFPAAKRSMRQLVDQYVPATVEAAKKSKGGGGGMIVVGAVVTVAALGTAYALGKKRGRAFG